VIRNVGAGMAIKIVTGDSGAAQHAILFAYQLDWLRNSRKRKTAAAEILRRWALSGHAPEEPTPQFIRPAGTPRS
jgi:hypothetical protein